MYPMEMMSNMRRDFIASNLRSQINRLSNILVNLEEDKKVDCDYANESLKEIENRLRQIRKLCADN
ncbi:MAG: hypothetical protein PHJ00_00985 [Candidatus Omnitrophica bacterium]|nr:hypothetical protein [Candidatus Omnitrophota bacterium]MDD5654861.1 hypothetical protein [Candidatus Omnitrophota bacterium]